MDKKIRKNLHIEILKYAHEQREFFCRKLADDLNFNENEKKLFFEKLIHDKTLLQNTGKTQKTDIGEENFFMISTEGRFKLLEFEQLENASQTSTIAINKATTSIKIAYIVAGLNVIALIIATATLFVSQSSLRKTQQSLELSTSPEVSITVVDNGLDKNNLRQPGHSQISNAKANFILKNNFLGELKDIDIKMIILEIHPGKISKHPVVCPFAYVNYTDNPNFKIDENWRTYSILDNKLYNLKSLEEKHFSIDYKNLNSVLKQASSSKFFIKISANYKRAIDNKSFLLTKIYKIDNWVVASGKNEGLKTEYLVDTDIDKQIIVYNDLNNQILMENDFKYPLFTVYPFKNSNFTETLKSNFLPPYSLEQSECEYFELNKKIKIIE